jgi:hypothetical protein
LAPKRDPNTEGRQVVATHRNAVGLTFELRSVPTDSGSLTSRPKSSWLALSIIWYNHLQQTDGVSLQLSISIPAIELGQE